MKLEFSNLKILVAVPTFNEVENVEELHRRIRNTSTSWKILYIDDASPDGTGNVLDKIARTDVDTVVIHRQGRSGIGSAHKVAISYAYSEKFDVLVTLDGDLTHQPEDIPTLIVALDQTNVVVGSRFEGGIRDWSLVRRIMTRTGHFLTKNLLRIPYDSTSAFRAYNLNQVKEDVFEKIPADSYSFFFESLLVLHRCSYEILDVPTVLTARFSGDSKMRMQDVVEGIWKLVTSPFKYRNLGK